MRWEARSGGARWRDADGFADGPIMGVERVVRAVQRCDEVVVKLLRHISGGRTLCNAASEIDHLLLFDKSVEARPRFGDNRRVHKRPDHKS